MEKENKIILAIILILFVIGIPILFFVYGRKDERKDERKEERKEERKDEEKKKLRGGSAVTGGDVPAPFPWKKTPKDSSNVCNEGEYARFGICEDCDTLEQCKDYGSSGGCYANGHGCAGCYKCEKCPAGHCPAPKFKYTCDLKGNRLCSDPNPEGVHDGFNYYDSPENCASANKNKGGCICQNGSTPREVSSRSVILKDGRMKGKLSACNCSTDPKNAYKRGYLCDIPWKAGRCPIGFKSHQSTDRAFASDGNANQKYNWCMNNKTKKSYVACKWPGVPNKCPAAAESSSAYHPVGNAVVTDARGQKFPMHDCKFTKLTLANECILSGRGIPLKFPGYSLPKVADFTTRRTGGDHSPWCGAPPYDCNH